MSIINLMKVLAPPDIPNEAGLGVKWPLIDDGVPFPSDYIEFINAYGSGRIANFIVIFNPFSNIDDINFFEQRKLIFDDLNYLIEDDKDYYKYILYPKESGLLPVGVTDNGDYIFWVTSPRDNSNLWSMAIIASRSPDIEYFEGNLTFLLESILLRNKVFISLPTNFPSSNIIFDKI